MTVATLIALARAAAHRVEPQRWGWSVDAGSVGVDIHVDRGRWRYAVRRDVRLDLTKKIRTVAATARLLGLAT